MLIHNADITGSLLVNGTGYNTGSFSGSFTGIVAGTTATASYVEYNSVANKPALVSGSSQITYSGLTGIPSGIVSGSSQVTYSGLTGVPSGIVSGSSQVTYSGLTGIPVGIVSGSSQVTYSGLTGIPSGIVSGSAQIVGYGVFATTGSNGFNGSQSITGSLTVTGQVVAQTLNVQQVTSSIVYSSGSNIFGNTLANTQQFTGSMLVTGSLAVAGAGTFASSVGINGSPGTNFPLEAYINSSTAYSSTSRGNVFRVYNSNTGANIFAGIELGGAGSANDGLAGLNAIVTGNGSAALTFYTRDSNTFAERIRITSGGNVGIGTTSPTGRLMLYQSSAGNVFQNIVSNQGGSTQVGINLSPSMTDAEVASNPAQASIYATDSNYGANIIFATKATGAVGNALVTRLTIASTGAATLTTTDNQGGLLVTSATDNTTIRVASTATNGQEWRLQSTGGTSGLGQGKLVFKVGTTETASYIPLTLTTDNSTNGGRVGIGTTSPSTFLHVFGANTANRGQLSIQSNNASNAARASWYYDTTLQGNIGTTSGDFYIEAINNLSLLGNKIVVGTTSSSNTALGTKTKHYIVGDGSINAAASHGSMFVAAGTTLGDTEISVNQSTSGMTMILIASINTSTGTSTNSAMYIVRFYFSGNNTPTATYIGGSSDFVTFGQSGSNTLTLSGSSAGNKSYAWFVNKYGDN